MINALLARDWRIVHIAGHGEPPLEGDPRGVVLSNGAFLGPREICNMEPVPALVFVNCCHLAAFSREQLVAQGRRDYDRAQFAAGVAEELIKIGVRCVVAAGWAVSDDAAKAFATTFYDELLAGRRFIDAVAAARKPHTSPTTTRGLRINAMAIPSGGSPSRRAMRNVPRVRSPTNSRTSLHRRH